MASSRALLEGTPGGLHVAGAHAGTAAPAPVTVAQPPFWVVPAASAEGRLGAFWRTRLEISNPGSRPARVRLELFGSGTDPDDPPRVALELSAHQTLRWSDAVGALFERRATGAIRVQAVGGRVVVRSRTVNTSAAGSDEALLPALVEADAVRPGGHATFTGLVAASDPSAGVRTNLGMLNVAAIPIRIRVAAFDGEGRRLGEIGGELGPRGFGQLDDIFARFEMPATNVGRVEVTTETAGGAFLAYASVIRGPQAQAEYRFPRAFGPSATPR